MQLSAAATSAQERVREYTEKERKLGARDICLGWEAGGARRWVGGGRGDVELEGVVVRGVKVV